MVQINRSKVNNIVAEAISAKEQEEAVVCKYMLSLMRSALNGEDGEAKPEECSWKSLYTLIHKNNVQGLTYYAVEHMTEKMPEKLVEIWKNRRDAIVYRKLMMDEERKAILTDLQQKNISYMVLKGGNIEKYYPNPGMRDMADNDILYGRIEADENGGYRIIGNTKEEQNNTVSETQKVLLEYMQNRGYETSGFYEKDDLCKKDDFYIFEMHRDLMDEDSKMLEYYRNPWKNAKKKEGSDYEYQYSPEDEYIFYIAHEYKHFSSRGCGVRNLADIYVFLRTEKDNLDWDYIHRELINLDIDNFEAKMRKIAFDALSPNGYVDEEDMDLLLLMCSDGTFGQSKTAFQRRVKSYSNDGEHIGLAVIKYYYHRFLPPDSFYEKRYPFFYRHRMLRPLLSVYRTVKGVFFHTGHLSGEMKDVLSTKGE